jgi:hypothetical protein
MEFGALMFFTDYAIPATNSPGALEARGFESVWAPEYSHIPTQRKSICEKRYHPADSRPLGRGDSSRPAGLSRCWVRGRSMRPAAWNGGATAVPFRRFVLDGADRP